MNPLPSASQYITGDTYRRITIISIIAILLGIMGVVGYLFLATGKPNRPVLIKPDVNEVLRGREFIAKWKHGALSSSSPINSPEATHFVICLDRTTNTPFSCQWPGTWHRSKDQIPHQSPQPNIAQAIQNYTFNISQDPDPQFFIDGPANWTVGACSGPSDDLCAYAEPRPVTILIRNIAASGINTLAIASKLLIFVEVTNTSEVRSGSFSVAASLRELLLDANTNIRTDVDAPDIPDTAIIITTDGEEVEKNYYTPGKTIAGIHLRHTYSDSLNVRVPDLSPQQEANVDKNFEIPSENLTQTSVFLVIVKADISNSIDETDESDNNRIFTKTYYVR